MYSVKIANKGGFAFNVKSGAGEVVIDAKGEGLKPMAAFLAGLGSCIGVYIRKYARDAKLDLKEFDIKVESDLCEEKPVRFKEIDIDIDLKGAQIDEGRKKALLLFAKNCPARHTLKEDTQVNLKVV